MGLVSPVAAAFWLTAGAGLALPQGEGRAAAAAAFLVGVTLAGLAYRCALAALIGWGRRFLPVSTPWLDGLCGAGCIYFGLRLLLPAVGLP
jgi:threonine/homoserine/homoserine lactone efflux protein